MKKRSEFLSLCIHAYRQQRTLFLWTIGVGLIFLVKLLLILIALRKMNLSMYPFYRLITWPWLAAILVASFIYCGRVFAGVQKTREAFLSERGISPGKIWWSRVVTFAIPYMAILLLGCLMVFIENYTRKWPLQYTPSKFIDELVATLLFIIPQFFVGIFVSMFLRRPIVSILVTAALNYALLFWGILMLTYLGTWTVIQGVDLWIPTLLWSTVPLYIMLVIASRLRTDNRLHERSVWQSKRSPLLCVALTFAAICVAIPFYRIYSIPSVDHGFRIDPLVSIPNVDHGFLADPQALSADFVTKPPEEKIDWDYLRKAPDVETMQKRWESLNQALADPSRGGVTPVHFGIEMEVIEGIKNLLLCKSHQVTDSLIIRMKERNPPIFVNNIDTQFLDDSIALLDLIDTKRVSYTERLARIYERDYRRSLVPDTNAATLPWDRQRYRRAIHYHFQMQSYFAEKAEQVIFHNDKNIDPLLEFYKYRDSLYKDENGIRISHSQVRPPEPYLLSFGETTFLGIDIRWIYRVEATRRALILKLALIKYFKEHEQLPDSLEELKTSGILAEIPQLPYYQDFSFYYDPSPDTNVNESSPYPGVWPTDHKPGTPYLWAEEFLSVMSNGQWGSPFQYRRPNIGGLWVDLDFRNHQEP